MTQKLNVSSAVEFDRFIFSVSEFEVGQKKKQENGTKAKNVPGYREISTAVHTGPVTFREPDPHKACNRHR